MNRAGLVWTWLLILMSFSFAQNLPEIKPEDAGISSERLNRVRPLILEAIARKDFPGAVLVVGRKGRIVFRDAFGESQWVPEPLPMNPEMIFDISSITKPVATATCIMILVESGIIRLWDEVNHFVPQFQAYREKNGKKGGDARLWHLLTHTSGLPPYLEPEEIIRKCGPSVTTEILVDHIARMEKSNPPGDVFHYSCLGYITLAYILEKVTGQSLDRFADEHIFRPLKMNRTFFSPPKELHNLCVPTEVIDGQPLIGVVHDALARMQSGVSGNAGLFSTADDLAVFAQMMLNNGMLRGRRILSPLAVERMTTVYPEACFSGRGLGWDLNSAYATNGGDIFGPNSFGHSGYTGTSIWIDPDTETFVIFLTNRVHPSDGGSVIEMRSKVANVVAGSIIKR
ncbi:MAG: serine hydrolase [Candidatus Aminicenantes bacterium]|nr:serine hydrolase [Candidatus Aminicenantes bacterium]